MALARILRVCLAGWWLVLCSGLQGYVLDSKRWQGSTLTMQLQLDPSPLGRTLIDGSTSWGQVAETALSEWNSSMSNLQFTVVRNSNAPLGKQTPQFGNPTIYNNVFFSSNVYGDSWGSGVVGVTITYTNTTRRLESDVIFNSNRSWDSYRGSLRSSLDFKRVALHEFGHVLGLDHPDQSGQSVTAIMNSTVSAQDGLAADDRAGAAAGYGVVSGGATAPSGLTVSFSPSVAAGSTATFTVSASGTTPFTYQWFKNSVPISGATSVTLTLFNVQSGDSGSYTVTVTNSAGSATSSPAVFTVLTSAPVLLTQPVSRSVAVGGTATFSVTASGNGPLFYQWYRNGISIPGATTSTLQLTNVQSGQEGNYTVMVSNAGGSVLSSAAVLTVTAPVNPPVILAQPLSQAGNVGGTIVLSVTVGGTPPFVYQWLRDGVVVQGATSSTLQLSSLRLSDAGGYTVLVSNAAGSTLSSTAAVAVSELAVPPSISSISASPTVLVGADVTLVVVVTGSTPISYVWRKNTVIVPGASQSSLRFPSVQVSDAGSYTVTASNSAGSVTSPVVLLTVTVPVVAPSILVPPVSQSVLAGARVVFSVTASGTEPLRYQWKRDNVDLPGATSASLILASAQVSDVGRYTVTVSNSAGSVTSAGALLAVTPPPTPPAILAPPAGLTTTVGSAVSFSVTASGSSPLSYQWSKGGVPIPGATQSSYLIASARISDGGGYAVTVSNSAGSVTSPEAVLAVLIPSTPPVIFTHPASQTVTAGAAVTLSVVATGTPPLSYQWRKAGVPIAGATGPSLVLNPVQEGDAAVYSVVVTNAQGSVTSTNATLNVNPAPIAPAITVQPVPQSAPEGGSVTYSVTATGTAPLSYQWRRQGVPLPGATSAALTLADLGANQAGDYTVVVTNVAGSVTSAVATLTVTPRLGSRISNVSIRTTLAANQPLIVGLSMAGGSKPVLVRAVGPGLSVFGVGDAMPDPELSLFASSQLLAGNDDWGGGTDLAGAFAAVGAFALPPASQDAALLGPVEGGRTAQVSGPVGGNVLVEAYDAGTGNTPRLVNVSARNRVGTGGEVLIAGFTLTGNTSKTVLIRAIGPTLSAFGVPGALSDPKVEVYSGSTRVDENDDWAPALAATFSSVGAFGLVPGSKDAALLLTLPPGGYTVQVGGVAGSAGEALIELYEVAP